VHIGYFVPDFPPEVGAGPARVVEMSRHWIAAGERVTVFTTIPSRRLPGLPYGAVPEEFRGKLKVRGSHEGIDVVRNWVVVSGRQSTAAILAHNFSFLATGSAALATHRDRPDIAIVSGPPYFPLYGGAVAARLRNIPMVLELRDLWPEYAEEMGLLRSTLLRRVLHAADRRLMRSAAAIVTVTESFRLRIEEKVGNGVPTGVFPNGVDADFYTPGPTPTNDSFTFGYIGTFGFGQDLPAVVRAFARFRAATGARSRLLLVGDGNERRKVEAAITDAGAADTISIRLPIPRDETVAFYRSCDAVVVPLAAYPTLRETVPSKLFEAMSCGRAVIGAFRGEAERIIEESGCGIVAEPGDAESIADAMARMRALSPERRAEMGAAGRTWVLGNASRAAISRRYLEFIRSVAGSRR
jgi:colanic acid biosynthesis glycosyl transferase WcaI